jgi:hypothetical protein
MGAHLIKELVTQEAVEHCVAPKRADGVKSTAPKFAPTSVMDRSDEGLKLPKGAVEKELKTGLSKLNMSIAVPAALLIVSAIESDHLRNPSLAVLQTSVLAEDQDSEAQVLQLEVVPVAVWFICPKLNPVNVA